MVTFIGGLLPALVLLFSLQPARADSATWSLNPTNGDWNTAANWTPNAVPNGPADTATFGVSSIVNLSTSATTEVNSIVFNAGANAFSISPNPAFPFTISGTGITNSSPLAQNFIGGAIAFTNSASAGNLTTLTASGATSSGGTAGSIAFFDLASAGNATLIAYSGSGGGAGGLIQFSDNSSGGTAAVQLADNGTLDLSGKTGGLTIGSLAGSGAVNLGATTLTLNGVNQSTVFSGIIQGTGGLVLAVGTIELTTGNTYSGGTTYASADGLKVLILGNHRGSATGTGFVSVNGGGILAGSGTITGPVSINAGSQLQPSYGFTTSQRMNLPGGVAFTNLGKLTVVVDLDSGHADTITANGVALSGGVGPVLVVSSTGTRKRIGTVFKVINNTSANPITGTFFNFPEGSFINLGGGIELVISYVGGDGNDFTLTEARHH